MNHSRWIIFNGEFKRAGQRLVSAESRSVWYGDGCFETLRAYSGQFFALEEHLERLVAGLRHLRIDPPAQLTEGGLRSRISGLLKKNDLVNKDAVVRVQCWREGGRGFRVESALPSGYSISVLPLAGLPDTVSLATVPVRRIPSESLCSRFKFTNSINYIQAASEASERAADDALMLTTNDSVSETTIANIFWLRDQTVYTPSESCDILPGITRRTVLELLGARTDVQCREGSFSLDHVMDAESVWICNSIRELLPVESIDAQPFEISHPFFKELKASFDAHVGGHLA